jgi:hypothetical protein
MFKKDKIFLKQVLDWDKDGKPIYNMIIIKGKIINGSNIKYSADNDVFQSNLNFTTIFKCNPGDIFIIEDKEYKILWFEENTLIDGKIIDTTYYL